MKLFEWDQDKENEELWRFFVKHNLLSMTDLK